MAHAQGDGWDSVWHRHRVMDGTRVGHRVMGGTWCSTGTGCGVVRYRNVAGWVVYCRMWCDVVQDVVWCSTGCNVVRYRYVAGWVV